MTVDPRRLRRGERDAGSPELLKQRLTISAVCPSRVLFSTPVSTSHSCTGRARDKFHAQGCPGKAGGCWGDDTRQRGGEEQEKTWQRARDGRKGWASFAATMEREEAGTGQSICGCRRVLAHLLQPAGWLVEIGSRPNFPGGSSKGVSCAWKGLAAPWLCCPWIRWQ